MNTAKAFFSPLENFSDRVLLITGLAASAAGLGLSAGFDVAQDGIFDLHIARLPFHTHLLFLAGNIFLTALGLFLAGKVINPGTRLIDMVKVSMIARIPLYLAIPFIGNRAMVSLSERLVKQTTSGGSMPQMEGSDMAFLLLLSLVSILFLAGFFILLVNGFRVAANAKKWQHYLLLAAVILAAEVLSKFLYAKMVVLF